MNLIPRVLFLSYMVSAEDIRTTLLKLAEANRDGVTPAEVAKQLRPAQWREILDHVELVVKSLATEGKITRAMNGAPDRYLLNGK